MNTAVWIVLAVAAGYGIGRWQPAHRTSQWAAWQSVGKRPTGLRYWAVWTVLSVENVGWLIAHPVQGWHAWKHRNDPPVREPAPVYDPNWAQRRR